MKTYKFFWLLPLGLLTLYVLTNREESEPTTQASAPSIDFAVADSSSALVAVESGTSPTVPVVDENEARTRAVKAQWEMQAMEAILPVEIEPPNYVPDLPSDESRLSHAGREVLWAAFRRWGAEAGAEALEYALAAAPLGSDLRLDLAREAMLGWAKVAPLITADYVASLATPGQDFLLFTLPYAVAAEHSEQMFTWIRESVPAEHRRGTMQHTVIALLSTESQSAYDWAEVTLAEATTLSVEASAGLEEVFLHSARTNLEDMKAAVIVMPSAGRSLAARTVLPFVADQSVPEAVDWARAVTNSRPADYGSMDDFLISASLLFEEKAPAEAAWFTKKIQNKATRSLLFE